MPFLSGAVDVRADDPKLKRLEPPRLKTWEKFFLPQIAVGLGVTAQHIAGVMFANKAITVQYPEEQHVPSPNYRGVHRLNKDEAGSGQVRGLHALRDRLPGPLHRYRRGDRPSDLARPREISRELRHRRAAVHLLWDV